MAVAGQKLDYSVLLDALDIKRVALGWSWRQVAAEIDVPMGLFTHLRQGKGCMDCNLVAMLVWLGLAKEIEPFFAQPEPEGL
jgi:hypothetical protein